ncbi:DNA polymerase IV [Rhodoflexus caldus]|uniref:DNA polymerase IV n=1 Tax=Rhodoflexus caldus TaxID=2891236 RepID=UPI00202A1E16|nr:DNA polymerase IV [Rhodoflexus caldus]
MTDTRHTSRCIVHFDLDSFFVSVERLKNPALVGKPVIIGSKEGRGVVSSCSYEARQYGVHSAMPGVQAYRLCPQGIFVRGSMSDYGHYSRMVRDIIAAEAPVFEQASIDEFYLDLSGMERFFHPVEWTQRLRQRIIRETGLPISCGMASSKTVAKVATGQAKPNGEKFIPMGEEKSFLAPLPIDKLPFLGGKTGEQLRKMGYHYLRDIQQAAPEHLQQLLGKHGQSVWERANGICHSQVAAYDERKSISKEHTFEEDHTDLRLIDTMLKGMAEKLAFKLRRAKLMTGCVAVKIRYPGFDTHTKQVTIPYTTDDFRLMTVATELFRQLYNGKPVRLIGLRFSNLMEGNLQTNLFEDNIKNSKLYAALDRIKEKHGQAAVNRASGWMRQTPESSTPNFFQVSDEDSSIE